MASRLTTRTIVLALTAAAFMAAAGAASAKKHHHKKHKLGPVVTSSATGSGSGLGAVISETATCPGKTRAVGGGFAGSPPDNSVLPLVFESQKVGQKAWRASSQIADVSAPGASASLTAVVLCRRNAPVTSTASATVATSNSAQVGPTASAACPPNGKLRGGGFATGQPLSGSQILNLVIASAPSGPSTWDSTVISDRAGTLTSFAYCAKPKKVKGALTQVSGTTASATTSGSITHAVATCPGLLRSPQIGGFTQNAALTMGGGYLFPYESRASSKDWNVFGAHVGTAPTPLTAVALCG